MLDTGAHAARGAFRAQRQAFAVAIVKGIHLLFHHVGYFADSALKQRRMLDDRQADFAVAIAGQYLLQNTFDTLPDNGVGRQIVVHAADGLDVLRHVISLFIQITPDTASGRSGDNAGT